MVEVTAGTSATSNKTAIIIPSIGRSGREIFPMLGPLIAAYTEIAYPNGGVVMLKVNLIATIAPKCTGIRGRLLIHGQQIGRQNYHRG